MEATEETPSKTGYMAAYQLLRVIKIPLAFVVIRPEEAEGG